MVYKVALTGGIGSGKSTIADAFGAAGIEIIDADIIARQVVEPGQPALDLILQHFGPDILLQDGRLDRRSLRERIFNSAEEKQWLSDLLHPRIQQITHQLMDQATSPYVLWVVPLLVENQLQRFADRILVVDVSTECQIERTIKRDNITRAHAQQILAAQATREQRLAIADDVINNESSPATIPEQVNALHQVYLELAERAAQQERQ